MNNAEFQRSLLRARTLAHGGDTDYWSGFQRGLHRAHHGESFGTAEEHELWLTLADSPDQFRAERGRGYRDGLAGRFPDPSDADRLRAELERLGLSQRGLARELDLDERTVRRWCAGDSPVPRVVWLAIRATRRDAVAQYALIHLGE